MAITKLVIGIGGAGLATSIALGTSFYLTSDYTIKQLLNKENTKKVSLKAGLKNQEEWLNKWKEYIKENKSDSGPKKRILGN